MTGTFTLLALIACQSGFEKDGSEIGEGSQTNEFGEDVDEQGNSVSTPNHDWDGDGYTENEGDCDDDNLNVHPGMEEEYYDDLDANCDGLSDFDADQDGHISDNWGGDDCDDNNPNIYPGMEENPTDGIDSDCDGELDPRFISYSIFDEVTESVGANAMDVDADNRIHLVFEEAGELWYTNKTMLLGSWRTPLLLGLDADGILASGGNGQQLDGSVDSNYQFHVAFTETDSVGNLALNYAYLPDVRVTVPNWFGPFEIDGLSATGFDQAGHYANIGVGSDNLPIFAYYNQNSNTPMAVKLNAIPQENQTAPVNFRKEVDYIVDNFDQSDGAPMGIHTTLATGANNMAYVVYLDETAPYATGTNPSTQHTSLELSNGAYLCESNEIVEPGGIAHAAAVNPNGSLCIAYQDMDSSALKYACQAQATACENWTIETIEENIGSIESSLELEFTSTGQPYVGYYHPQTGTVRIANKENDEWTITTAASGNGKDLGQNLQMIIDSEDRVHMTFFNSTDSSIWYAVGR
jgi:hypothetical protein